jgi:hypothetical protein
LSQILLPRGDVELDEVSDDPWHDLPVAQLVPGVEVRRALRSANPGLVSSEATFPSSAKRRGATSARSQAPACGGGQQGIPESCAPRNSRH